MPIAAADFDGDNIAHHMLLHQYSVVFYFSSDRPAGERFRLDFEDRFGNKQFPRFCLAPMDNQLVNLSHIELIACDDVKASWLKPKDCTITISGSKLGLSIAQANVDTGPPFLYDTTLDEYEQKWDNIVVIWRRWDAMGY